MILSLEELKSIYYGAYSFEETEDGYLRAYQYSAPQIEYFSHAFEMWYPRCMSSTAKTLEFTTDATSLSLDYKIIWTGSDDTFELCVDDLISKIIYVENLEWEGTLNFTMEAGHKSVILYLPAEATVLIKNVDINAGVTPVKKSPKVLWLGDSITQGYGTSRSACTYVSVANRILNYDIINQGIGGYIYDCKSLMRMEGYMPDKIIVALGTNQYGCESMRDVEEYYEVLTSLYPTTPTLCITPIWRGDHPEEMSVFTSFCGKVRDIAMKYPNITVVDGFKLVPHLPEYYKDLLHPNALGAEIYARNLVKVIEEIGF